MLSLEGNNHVWLFEPLYPLHEFTVKVCWMLCMFWSHHFVYNCLTIRAPPVFCSPWTQLTQLWMGCTCDVLYKLLPLLFWKNLCCFLPPSAADFTFLTYCVNTDLSSCIFFSCFVWSAPEVLSGGPYNHAADWWSLGIMLFSLVTGEVSTNKLYGYQVWYATSWLLWVFIHMSEWLRALSFQYLQS